MSPTAAKVTEAGGEAERPADGRAMRAGVAGPTGAAAANAAASAVAVATPKGHRGAGRNGLMMSRYPAGRALTAAGIYFEFRRFKPARLARGQKGFRPNRRQRSGAGL
jgi:hypothetical protein